MSIMSSERLEAFSDGVIAIIITIMVLELEIPKDYTVEGIYEIMPVFLSYFMSFLYVAVYWVGHHQLFKIAKKINGQALWANLGLLFWLSLIPFATDWIAEGDHHTDAIPIIVYGVVLLMSQIAFLVLRNSIVNIHGKTSEIGLHLNRRATGAIFVALYGIGILATNINPFLALGSFLLAGFLKAIELHYISKHKAYSLTT